MFWTWKVRRGQPAGPAVSPDVRTLDRQHAPAVLGLPDRVQPTQSQALLVSRLRLVSLDTHALSARHGWSATCKPAPPAGVPGCLKTVVQGSTRSRRPSFSTCFTRTVPSLLCGELEGTADSHSTNFRPPRTGLDYSANPLFIRLFPSPGNCRVRQSVTAPRLAGQCPSCLQIASLSIGRHHASPHWMRAKAVQERSDYIRK
jgi:hypothetical protein